MLRRLPLLLALCLLWAGLAHAQFSLTVLQPAAEAGVVPNTVPPDATWGFGDPNVLPPVTGICQWATPDTLATTSDITTLGNLTGKVAVVQRGVVLRSHKVWRCQRAGAIAVVMINNTAAPPSILASEDSGALVTIPVILVPKAWGDRLRAAIGAGQVQVRLGNIQGQFPRNLSVNRNDVFAPTQFILPDFMVRTAADLSFTVGGKFRNFGTQAASNAVLRAEVLRLGANPARIWADSFTVASMAVGDSADQRLGNFSLVQALGSQPSYRGAYRLRYTAYEPGQTDGNPNDNTVDLDFHLDSATFSKGRLNLDRSSPTYYQPVFTAGYSRQGGGAIKWGHYLRVGSVGANLISMTCAVTSNGPPGNDLAGEAIDVEVHEWADANNDSAIQAAEVTLLANGTRVYNNQNEAFVFYTLEVSDVATGTAGIALEPGKRYLLVVSYAGNKTIFIAADDAYINYQRNFLEASTGDWYTPLFNGTGWGYFGNSPIPAMRATLSQATAVAPRLGAKGLSVYPNPASGAVTVQTTAALGQGPGTLRVVDATGRICLQQALLLGQGTQRISIGTQSLAPGLYTVEVAGPKGVAGRRLSVVR